MTIASLLFLAVALCVVGALQYRWLHRLSDQDQVRMRSAFDLAVQRLADEMSMEITSVVTAFRAPERDDVASIMGEWRRRSPHPDLVAAIFVLDRDGDSWSLRRLDARTSTLVASVWPAALQPLRQHLAALPERGPGHQFSRPLFASIPALFVVQMPQPNEREFFLSLPRRVIIVQLDRAVLDSIAREHAKRIFAAIEPAGVDVALTAGAQAVQAGASRTFTVRGPEGPLARDFGNPPPDHDVMRVNVRHRAGGYEAIVAAAHRRNLAVAFLVLLLLGASSLLLIVLVRRGEQLRVQQARFVALMSHELNTPLTVLRIASENLQDGIARDPEKVSRYVRTIAGEAARLSEMVGQVLDLARMNSDGGAGKTAYEAVSVRSVLEQAVAQARWLPESNAVQIETEIEEALPQVHGDPQALVRAIQNLVTNAIRYGAKGQWVGVRAARESGFVRIEVRDRGPGIDMADAEHLFDPFYRGRGTSTVRGSGLGLTIVQQIVVEHGGSVSVQRNSDSGVTFLVRLPAGVTRG